MPPWPRPTGSCACVGNRGSTRTDTEALEDIREYDEVTLIP
jgi:hypothetical protein